MIFLLALFGGCLGWLWWRLADEAVKLAQEPPAIRPQEGDNTLRYAITIGSALIMGYLWATIDQTEDQALAIGGYAFFLLIALIDFKYRLIPNALVYPAIVAVAVGHIVFTPETMAEVIMGGALTLGIFGLTAWLKPGDLGGGDIKLAFLIGLAFGFPQVLWALIMGVGAGAIAVLYLLLVARRGLHSTIPYAPFLCLGAMIALLYNPLANAI